MKFKMSSIEIVLIILSGLFALSLSVYKVIQGEKEKEELKKTNEILKANQEKQISEMENLRRLNTESSVELNSKSNEIIELQKLLQDKTENQLVLIERLNNPIPAELGLDLTASFDITPSEFEEIRTSYPLERGNTLPLNIDVNNNTFIKINKIKDLLLRISIQFMSGDKMMTVIVEVDKIPFFQYNTVSIKNSFLIYLDDKTSKIIFNSHNVKTKSITTNYNSPSLKDFNSSKVKIQYEFFYPYKKQLIGFSALMYAGNRENDLFLDITKVGLRHNNYTISIDNIKRLSKYEFEGVWKGSE